MAHVCARTKRSGQCESYPLRKTDSVIIFFIEWKFVYQVQFFSWKRWRKKEKKSFFSRPRKFSVSAHPESATPVVGRRPIGPIERVYLKTFPPHHHLCMRLRPSRYIHPWHTHRRRSKIKTPLSLRKDPPRTTVVNLRFFSSSETYSKKQTRSTTVLGRVEQIRSSPGTLPTVCMELPLTRAHRVTRERCVSDGYSWCAHAYREKKRQFNISRKNDVRNVRNLKKHRYRQRKIRHVPP